MGSDFGNMCRALRVTNGLKQREVAVVLGIKLSTYGNVESSQFKVIRREKVDQLSRIYKLPPADHLALLEAWGRTPISEYSVKQREAWKRKNKFRSKVKNYDRVVSGLIDVIGLLLVAPDPGVLCNCLFGGGSPSDPNRSCELCYALESLGFSGFTTKDDVAVKISMLQDRIEFEHATDSEKIARSRAARGLA